MDIKVYATLDEINHLVFELARSGISFDGPRCDCGDACELGVMPKCEEVFLILEKRHTYDVIHLAREECLLDEFRIEEVPDGKGKTSVDKKGTAGTPTDSTD